MFTSPWCGRSVPRPKRKTKHCPLSIVNIKWFIKWHLTFPLPVHCEVSAVLGPSSSALVLAWKWGKYHHGLGDLLYKMGKVRYPTASQNPKHNHNTQQPTWAVADLPSSGFDPLAPWVGQQHHQLMALPLPIGLRNVHIIGLGGAAVGSPVWGAIQRPIENERDRRGVGLMAKT